MRIPAITAILILTIISCDIQEKNDPEVNYELEGFWKVYYKTWDNPELTVMEGAVKIVQDQDQIEIISHDTLMTSGSVTDNKILLESIFLEEGIEEIKIRLNDTLLTGAPLVEAIDYFKLIKIDLSDNWKVLDNWFDGSTIDLGMWKIEQSDLSVTIERNNEIISDGHINYDTITINDIPGYGIQHIFIMHNDILKSEMPMMESSNGLTFIRN